MATPLEPEIPEMTTQDWQQVLPDDTFVGLGTLPPGVVFHLTAQIEGEDELGVQLGVTIAMAINEPQAQKELLLKVHDAVASVMAGVDARLAEGGFIPDGPR